MIYIAGDHVMMPTVITLVFTVDTTVIDCFEESVVHTAITGLLFMDNMLILIFILIHKPTAKGLEDSLEEYLLHKVCSLLA